MGTYKYQNKAEFTIDLKGTKVTREISGDNIWTYPDAKNRRQTITQHLKRPILIIGFDTEFQSPEAMAREQVREAGSGRYEVLSYQFYCKILNPTKIEGIKELEWEGLFVPEIGKDGLEQRVPLAEFLIFALGSGIEEHKSIIIPDETYLVGHFTKADLPAFSDFKEIARNELDGIRRTLTDLKGSMKYQFHDPKNDSKKCEIEVNIRDTYLNAPTMAKSLADLGEIVGFEKLKLADDIQEEKQLKSNMKDYRNNNWETFCDYAIRDCVVCAKYFERVLDTNLDITGKYTTPFTLSSIGMDLVFDSWDKQDLEPLEVLGKEVINDKSWNSKLNRYQEYNKEQRISKVYFQEAFITETYHGGRNEQYWFGPCFEDDWYDYDLQSAYPTAMALIGLPDWTRLKVYENKKSHLKPIESDDLCFVLVKFQFPKKTRYPVLPVRSFGGNLIFPLEGESYCTIAELRLAEKLGVKYQPLYAVHVPTDKSRPIFRGFIKDCIAKRSEHPKGSFLNYFWKEVGNSTYGKTAQGLRVKRAYDIRTDQTKPTPESRITNPIFASFITGFTRASLGEMMNALPKDKMVFSVTTDGFLTNATPQELEQASGGELAKLFFESRKQLVGKSEPVTEIKHQIRKPLGWRTRGQATLMKGKQPLEEGAKDLVCAKAGIKVEHYFDQEQQNIEIVEKFINRAPDDKVIFRPFISIKDQLRFDHDNVEYLLERVLSMEFDWKRRVVSATDHQFEFDGSTHNHLCFNTAPWQTVDQFRQMRDLWDEYKKGAQQKIVNLKSLEDLAQFIQFVNSRMNVGEQDRKYLRRVNAVENRVMINVISALFHSQAGFLPIDVQKLGKQPNEKLAAKLRSVGIDCTNSDVANHKKKEWVAGRVPNVPQAHALMKKLKSDLFENIKIEQFIWQGTGLLLKLKKDQLIDRMN